MKEEQVNLDVVRALEKQADEYQPLKAYTSRGETIFIQQCLQKHGNDYEAMALDIELNQQQHTPKQLQRKVHKYIDTLRLMNEVLEQQKQYMAQTGEGEQPLEAHGTGEDDEDDEGEEEDDEEGEGASVAPACKDDAEEEEEEETTATTEQLPTKRAKGKGNKAKAKGSKKGRK